MTPEEMDRKIEVYFKTVDDVERCVFGEDGEGLRSRMLVMETEFKNFKDFMVEKIDAIHAKTCGRENWTSNLISGAILVILGIILTIMLRK